MGQGDNRTDQGRVPLATPLPRRGLNIRLGGGASQKMSAALIAAVLAGLALVAIPLALWPRTHVQAGAATVAAPDTFGTAPSSDPVRAQVVAALEGGVETDSLRLGQPWIDRCERAGPGHTPRERCDRQPFFEEALVKAILENEACAKGLEKSATVSVALKVDYRRKRLRVFAGKSGSVGHFAAAGFIGCIQKSMPTPDWNALAHAHTNYVIAVVATIGSPGSS